MKKIVFGVFIVFIFYLLVWGIGELKQFVGFKYDLVKSGGNWNMYVDDDGYGYSVAMPYFLEFKGGNLSISPSLDMNNNDDIDGDTMKELYPESALIIWLKPFNGEINELGVIITEGNMQRQVYLTDSKNATYPDDQEYVERHQDEINILFGKAEKMWDLKMPWGK
ncbi:MAG: hypothetical protein K6B67_02930 [Lachnospiraceae bacterium]|nr:hypothetical protein [Lachnospiraceae bacterium]